MATNWLDFVKLYLTLFNFVHLCPFLSNCMHFCPTLFILSKFVQLWPVLTDFDHFCQIFTIFVRLCQFLSNFVQLVHLGITLSYFDHFCQILSIFVRPYPCLSKFVQLSPFLLHFVQFCPIMRGGAKKFFLVVQNGKRMSLILSRLVVIILPTIICGTFHLFLKKKKPTKGLVQHFFLVVQNDTKWVPNNKINL